MGIFCLSRVLFVFTVLKKGFKSVLNVSDSAAYLDLFNLKLKVILPDIFRRTLTFPLHVVSGLKVRSKDQWKPSEGWVLPGSAQRRLSGGDWCVNWLTEWTLICFLTDQMMGRDRLVVKTAYCLCLLAANRDQQWNLFYHCFPSFVCLSLPFCTFRKENPKH